MSPAQADFGPLVQPHGKIAVIGLGAAGIAAVTGLRQNGFSNITVFEASGNVGGTWVYSPCIKDARSSMYQSLRCNIPRQSMCYVNRPMPSNLPSFAPHRGVASYLLQVAEEDGILPLVRFNSPVARCIPVDPSSYATRWAIQTYVKRGASQRPQDENEQASNNGNVDSSPTSVSDFESDHSDTPILSDVEIFDAVLVCNGHFTGAFPVKRFYNLSIDVVSAKCLCNG